MTALDQSAISVTSNTGYRVDLSANTANFTVTGGGASTKPASDLEWSNGGTFTGIPQSTSPATVHSSTSSANGPVATVSYQIKVDPLQDPPETYSLGFTYTLIAQ